MARTYAGMLGLVALVTVLVRALGHGTAVDTALLQAWIGLVLFTPIGFLLGWIADRTVQEAVRGRMATELAAQEKPTETTTTKK